jgi:histone demethylase JARID1
MRRNPVFSHDELICKLIMQPDQLELCLLNSTMEDAKRMVKEETKLRSALNEVVCAITESLLILFA